MCDARPGCAQFVESLFGSGVVHESAALDLLFRNVVGLPVQSEHRARYRGLVTTIVPILSTNHERVDPRESAA